MVGSVLVAALCVAAALQLHTVHTAANFSAANVSLTISLPLSGPLHIFFLIFPPLFTLANCAFSEQQSDSRCFVFILFYVFQFTWVDFLIHCVALWFEEPELSLRSDLAGLFSRRQHVREPVALRRNSFCLGIAALVSTLSIMAYWNCGLEHQTFFSRWVGFRILFLPLLLQPYIGTVLLLELEMRELTVMLEEVVYSDDVPACRGLLQKIANVKGKWASFLRQQFVFGMLAPGIYGLLVFFTITDREVANDPLVRILFVSMLDAPFLLTSVCLHCSFLAMFNARVLKWQQETENNDIYRFLCQKESEFCFSIFGYSVTLAKLRFTLISLVLTVLSRLAQKFILWFQDVLHMWCIQLPALAAQQLCRCFCLKRVPTWTSWKWPIHNSLGCLERFPLSEIGLSLNVSIISTHWDVLPKHGVTCQHWPIMNPF